MNLYAFNWDTARLKNVFGVWEALLSWVEAVAFEDLVTGFKERAGTGKLTAVCQTKVTAVCLGTLLQAYREKLEFYTFSRDTAR